MVRSILNSPDDLLADWSLDVLHPTKIPSDRSRIEILVFIVFTFLLLLLIDYYSHL
jgi:hypothetical protein